MLEKMPIQYIENNLFNIIILYMYVIAIALFVSFLWGLAPIIHKHVLKSVDPKVVMVTGGLFYSICLFTFAIYYLKDIKSGFKKLQLRNALWIGFASIITAFIANLIYFYILKDHDSYVIAALIYSSPVFTLILAYYLLKEKVTMMGFVGVAFIMIGIICLALNEKSAKVEDFVNAHELE